MKFLFLANDLNIGGGVASALINLSNVLVKEGHEVSFYNLTEVQTLPSQFNNRIKLISLTKREKLLNLNNNQIKKQPKAKRPFLMMLGIVKKLMNKGESWQRFCFKKTFLSGYDVAIAFRQSPFGFWFVKNKTDAKTKIGFWHGDPDYMQGIEKWDYTIKYLDILACVSNAVRDKMKSRYPQFSDKMQTVYNIFNDKEIIAKSNYFIPAFDRNVFNIITVARIEFEQKQLQFIPQIAKTLKEKGYKFCWTIVGDGPDADRLVQLIKENGVENNIRLTGNQANPYPFIKNADLFVLTSIWESYGMVLTEALVLGVPCVAGDYPALKEIIEDNVNGIIAENSTNGILNQVEKVLMEKELYNRLKTNAEKYKYDYRVVYNQLMEVCKNDKI